MDFDTKSFADFLKYFSRRKNNLLRQSNQTPIKRLQVLTIDLSTQPQNSYGNNTVSNNGNSLFKIPTNFTGLHVQQIYQTSVPTTSRTGQIYLTFDDNNIGNINNSKLLQINDSFDLIDGEVANGWLWWNNQADTSTSIAFFIDMDYRAGSASTSIVGSVSTKYLAPSAISPQSYTNMTTTYTVPAGYTARVTPQIIVGGAIENASLAIGGVDLLQAANPSASTVTSVTPGTYTLATGTVLQISVGANGRISMLVELYANN